MRNAFDDLERQLPNGFHDAELLRVHVDYSQAEAVLELNIDTQEVAEATDVDWYRPARLTFLGLKVFAIDPPGAEGPFVVSTVTSGSGEPPGSNLVVRVPDDCFLAWFFLTAFNTFIRVAATDVRLEWLDGAARK